MKADGKKTTNKQIFYQLFVPWIFDRYKTSLRKTSEMEKKTKEKENRKSFFIGFVLQIFLHCLFFMLAFLFVYFFSNTTLLRWLFPASWHKKKLYYFPLCSCKLQNVQWQNFHRHPFPRLVEVWPKDQRRPGNFLQDRPYNLRNFNLRRSLCHRFRQ